MKSDAYNVKTIKNDNRALILNILRKVPTSRADIAKRTGLSKSSVTMITNALIDEGQVCEIGTYISSVGRKPILLDIEKDFRFAGGVVLHRHEVTVCLTNLKMEVISLETKDMKSFSTPDEIADFAADAFLRLVKKAKFSLDKCIGIGVSSPGPLDWKKGIILSPPELSVLKNTAVVEEIRQRTGVKDVVLENNAVLLAMCENLIPENEKFGSFISVIISHGIGSAIVTDGKIYRGAGGFSGEIGHISVVAGGEKCECGNSGCLEKYVSLAALKTKFGFAHYHEIVDMAYSGEQKALAVLEYICTYLGSGLVTAVNLFDLDAVILHGDYSYKPQLLCGMLEDYIGRNSLVAGAHSVRVLCSSERRDRYYGNSTAAIIEKYFDQLLEG